MTIQNARHLATGFLVHHHARLGELADWLSPHWRRGWLATKTRALINHDRVLRMDLGRMRPAGSGKEQV